MIRLPPRPATVEDGDWTTLREWMRDVNSRLSERGGAGATRFVSLTGPGESLATALAGSGPWEFVLTAETSASLFLDTGVTGTMLWGHWVLTTTLTRTTGTSTVNRATLTNQTGQIQMFGHVANRPGGMGYSGMGRVAQSTWLGFAGQSTGRVGNVLQFNAPFAAGSSLLIRGR